MCGEMQTRVLGALADGDCRTSEVLSEALDLRRKQVVDAVHRLVDRELVVRTEIGCYRITEAGRAALDTGAVLTSGPNAPFGAPARRQRVTLRDKLWRAMRIRAARGQKFTVRELLPLAEAGDEKAGLSNAGKYVAALGRAGYLAALARQRPAALTSNGEKRYALVRDSGPAAPVVRVRQGTVWDPNTGAEHRLDDEAGS